MKATPLISDLFQIPRGAALLFLAFTLLCVVFQVSIRANGAAPSPERYEIRNVSGWEVYIRKDLLSSQKNLTQRALNLLERQLEEIKRVVPSHAVSELQKVKLYFSKPYAGFGQKAEYHPSGAWLRSNDRDAVMAKGVEFTNIKIFYEETKRMPNFALHELAHAYHDRVLENGFRNKSIADGHARALASGKFDRVKRRDSKGRTSLDRSYALTNPQEYFAETTEAYFVENDFFPFNRQQLRAFDPAGLRLIETMWGVE